MGRNRNEVPPSRDCSLVGNPSCYSCKSVSTCLSFTLEPNRRCCYTFLRTKRAPLRILSDATMNTPRSIPHLLLMLVLAGAAAGRCAGGDADEWRDKMEPIAPRGYLCRHTEVSRGANGRYLGELASVSDKAPLSQETSGLCRAITMDAQRYGPINPWSAQDGALLTAISRGEYALAGFRNRDLRAHLYPGQNSAPRQRRQAGRVTRQLALRRAHELIKKVSGTHRWLLTQRGRRITTALLAARQADVHQLIQLAA